MSYPEDPFLNQNQSYIHIKNYIFYNNDNIHYNLYSNEEEN